MQLNSAEQDKIKEVINIGVGQGLVAFTKMIDSQIDYEIPVIMIERVEDASRRLEISNTTKSVVLLQMKSDGEGFMMLTFSPETASQIATKMTGEASNFSNLLEMDKSALRELGNIVSGASFTAFNRFLDINVVQSPPDIATDMYTSLVHSILAEIGTLTDQILIIKVTFEIASFNSRGEFLFLFTPQATKNIIEATDRKLAGHE
ncbi:MAG: hypothetical protein COU65_01940 [Candidatus Pacebacteria bacterium CG10_big_fil_rev_8_21_14_0_10_42_12]|nr:hypothetical protein [Candidatus Parcubacteria bacterium]NCS66774.1 hypothetical protein [Candidatus Peregrinibacteria bacterium]PIR62725.1 MAG: hypothetical protein COU65_01940 [Candidatus Pacebacteria bacterium CG10_big_fil_rev_8_21_14_0_10_42_12]